MLKIDQKQKVEDCSKLIKVSLHRENDGTQDLNLFMSDPLEVQQELIGMSRPLESNITHFRNTGTNKGKEYSTIQMVLYGGNELKRAHLNWVDPILA